MNLTWMTLFGGLCILIYGLDVARDNLEKLAGDRLRDILSRLTENRLIAFITGFFMTLSLQSTSASISMFVGFVASSLLTLTQAMALILGADVGATITVQLIAFRIADYSLLVIIIGSILLLLLGTKRQSIGKFILGIGFIFLGMWQMEKATVSFKDAEALRFGLELLRDHPAISLILSAIATAMLQSSAAFLGIMLSLTHSDILPLEQALPILIGANIGGCALPFLISLKSTDRGRQVAIAHLLLKISAALICFPFLPEFATLIVKTASSASRQLANAHFLFNVILAIIFLPLIHFGAKIINYLYPLKPEEEEFRPKYLDLQILSTPSFALGQAKREVIRMAEIVQEMAEKIIVILRKNDLNILSPLEDLEDRADMLYREIKNYLIQISQQTISEEQASQQLELIILTSDLEHIGDTIDKSIVPLLKKKVNKRLSLSEEGLREITDFHKQVIENFQLTISAFTTRNMELCHKVIRRKDQLLEAELNLRERHLERLRKGVQESIDTSTIHLELLSYLRRINSFISNIVYPILQKQEGKSS